MSLETALRTWKRHSVDTQTNMHFQFTDLHADTRSHTQALKTSDQSLGEFLCHAGSFIQRGSGYEQTLSQTQSQTFFILILLFFLVLFSFVFVFFFFKTPGRMLFTNTSKPSQGFGSDSNINSGCDMLLIWLVLLLQELFWYEAAWTRWRTQLDGSTLRRWVCAK